MLCIIAHSPLFSETILVYSPYLLALVIITEFIILFFLAKDLSRIKTLFLLLLGSIISFVLFILITFLFVAPIILLPGGINETTWQIIMWLLAFTINASTKSFLFIRANKKFDKNYLVKRVALASGVSQLLFSLAIKIFYI